MFTIILHDAPYTTERSWSGLRFAEKALDSGIPVRVFLFSDGVVGYLSPDFAPVPLSTNGRSRGKRADSVPSPLP